LKFGEKQVQPQNQTASKFGDSAKSNILGSPRMIELGRVAELDSIFLNKAEKMDSIS